MASLYWFDPHHKGWHFSCSRSGLVEARATAEASINQASELGVSMRYRAIGDEQAANREFIPDAEMPIGKDYPRTPRQ